MKASDVYRALRASLESWFSERGFKRARVSRLTFQKYVRDRYESVWFQCDKWGWDNYAGSSFFVNFTISSTPDVEGVVRCDERLNYFLTDEELEEARARRDAIVARIPRPPDDYFRALELQLRQSVDAAAMLAAVRQQFEPEPLPYARHHDLSLRYWQPADVAAWAAFIQRVLPRAVDEMAGWTLPPVK